MGITNFIFVKQTGMGKSPLILLTILIRKMSKTFVKFLGIFYEGTLRFSGSLFVISNIYIHELISIEDQL